MTHVYSQINQSNLNNLNNLKMAKKDNSIVKNLSIRKIRILRLIF
jgi:hypothetical protein